MKDSKQEIAEIADQIYDHIGDISFNIDASDAAVDMLAACLYHLRESGQPVNLDALYQIHLELEKMRAEEAESTK